MASEEKKGSFEPISKNSKPYGKDVIYIHAVMWLLKSRTLIIQTDIGFTQSTPHNVSF